MGLADPIRSELGAPCLRLASSFIPRLVSRPQISLLRLIISRALLHRAIFLRVHPADRLVRDAFRARRATFNFSPTTLTHFSSRSGTSYRTAFFLTIATREREREIYFAGRVRRCNIQCSRLARRRRGSFVIARLPGHTTTVGRPAGTTYRLLIR